MFVRVREPMRKDIERAFGVLQVKRKISAQPSHFMAVETMNTTTKCVIILHKMCVEERITLDVLEEEDEAYEDDVKVRGGVTPM